MTSLPALPSTSYASLTGRSRMNALASPTRPPPLKLQILNPARRPAFVSSPHSSGPLEDYDHLAQFSEVSQLSAIPTSKSLPNLPMLSLSRIESKADKVYGANTFKRFSNTIYGGLAYQRRQRELGVASKYMDYMPKEADSEAAERNRRRKLDVHRKMMREAGRMFDKADTNKDGQLDFIEFYDLVQMQAKLRRRLAVMKGCPPEKACAKIPSREMLKDCAYQGLERRS